jgi:hypothetical protein
LDSTQPYSIRLKQTKHECTNEGTNEGTNECTKREKQTNKLTRDEIDEVMNE